MRVRKYCARPEILFGLALLAGFSLAGCGRKVDSDRYGELSSSFNSSATGGRFGGVVEQSMAADPNSEPMNIADDELPPVDPTKEPLEVN